VWGVVCGWYRGSFDYSSVGFFYDYRNTRTPDPAVPCIYKRIRVTMAKLAEMERAEEHLLKIVGSVASGSSLVM